MNAVTYKWYDVTDYDSIDVTMSKRGRLSPLYLIQYIHKSKLADPWVKKITKPREGIIGEWFKCKIKCYLCPIALWGLMRFIVIVLFMIYEVDIKWVKQVGGIPQSQYDVMIKNSSYVLPANAFPICDQYVHLDISDLGLRIIRIALTSIACLSILKEILDYAKLISLVRKWAFPAMRDESCMKRRLPIFSQNTAVQYALYAFCDIICPICIAIIVNALPMMTSREGTTARFVEFVRIMTAATLLLNSFFLMQLVPYLGPFIITGNRLIADLFRFLLHLLIILMPSSFYMLTMVNLKSMEGCIVDFSSFPRGLYSTFLIVMHITDLSHLSFVSPGTLYMYHVAILLIIGLLMMNFLIGILSRSVAEMTEHMGVLCAIQHISVVMVVEYRAFSLLRPWYRRVQDKHFTMAKGRVYVVVKTHPNETTKSLQNWQADDCPIEPRGTQQTPG